MYPIAVLLCLLSLVGLFGCHGGDQKKSPQLPSKVHNKNRPMSFDFKHLEDELFRHGLKSFRAIRAKRPKDNFYCFAFFTNGEFSYAATTASSHEGLDEVARKYKKEDSYKNQSLEHLKIDLKWSPADSPLHVEVGEELAQLDNLFLRIDAELGRLFENGDDKSYTEFVDRVENAFLSALKRIDSTGVFGKGDARKKVIVNLLMGDQSDEERIRLAKQINPAEPVMLMAEEFEAAQKLWNARYE